MSKHRPCRRLLTTATALIFFLVGAHPAATSTAQVSSCPGELLSALQDAAVTTIELLNDCSLANVNGDEHVTLARNVTITGLPGERPVLDLAFRSEVISLCSQCWLTLTGVAITKARRGTGDGFDSVAGSEIPGAVLKLQDVVRKRIACTPAKDTAAVLQETVRSALLPNSTSGHQEFSLGTATYQGTVYPGSLLLADVGTDISLAHLEGRVRSGQHTGRQGHFGGLTLWEKNVTRVCTQFVTEECLATKPAEACVNEIIDQVETGAVGAAQRAGANPALVAAAVVVPTVVVGLFAAGVVVWLRRRRQHHQQLLPQHCPDPDEKPQQQRPYSVSFTSSRRSGDDVGVRLYHADSANEAMMKRRMSIDIRISQQETRPPLGGQMSGWEVAGIRTSPWVGQVQDVAVEFGELLGAGSFGRVYKARWAGQDVAVKVIEHTEATLSAVEAEADLLLSLNHPNLVRAYHYVTYTQEQQPSQLATSNSISSSQASQLQAVAQNATAAAAGWGNYSDSAMDKATPSVVPGGSQLSQEKSAAPPASERSQQHTAGVPPPGGALHSSTGNRSVGCSSRGSAGGQLERATTCSSSWQLKPAKAETWLVQEYCDMGTLSSVASAWPPATECEAQMLHRLLLLLDAAKGLAALHAQCVVHGDLNARNVLVSSYDACPAGMTAKVADLGLSKVIKHNTSHRTTNTVGTMSHTAPELMRYGRMAPSADVYSFGVMMWELFTNQVAFQKLHYGQFFETVVLQNLRPLIPPEMPADYMALMRKCWAGEPADRPSSKQLVDCLATLVADRHARVAGQACDAPRMAAFWALLGCQPPDIAAPLSPQCGGPPLGSPAGISSPVGSDCDGSWQGFVQQDVAAVISDGLPQVQLAGSNPTAAGPGGSHAGAPAAGPGSQGDSAFRSGSGAAGAQEHDDEPAEFTSQDQLPQSGVLHQTSWFV